MRLSAQQLHRLGYRQDEGQRWIRGGPAVEPDIAAYLANRPLCPRPTGPEFTFSCALTQALDGLTLSGALHAVWSATEASSKAGGHRGQRAQARLRAAGVNPGWPDFTFCWSTGSGLLELKSATGHLSHAQVAMRRWCQRHGVRHAVVRSVEDALEHLRDWGVLDR
jgi:hypothetical protein